MRSGYVTVVAGHAAARPSAPRTTSRACARLRRTEASTRPAALWFPQAALREGFIAPQLKLAVIPDHRLLRRAARRARRAARRGAIQAFTELRAGDIVVHTDHGIGRFTGFDTKTVAGVTRDYLEVEYRDGDRRLRPDRPARPAEPLRRRRRARAAALEARLQDLGQHEGAARRAARELAGELINLYAERQRRAGHGFRDDSDWQLEFERAFPYRETDDQLEAIEQTKADMESERPMDRLICGDVGYGKTEVALRAAFKAAADGKQVRFLAPTTILAQQHFGTFSERLRDYPFRIELLSRFRIADGAARW